MNTKTITIHQKQSNSGTIYDIRSSHFDIHLQFDENEKYAIVYPAYFNREILYYESIEEAHEDAEEYATIIDRNGNIYDSIGWGEYEIIGTI